MKSLSFYRMPACCVCRAWCYYGRSLQSICPSHCGILSKWMHISSNSFHPW